MRCLEVLGPCNGSDAAPATAGDRFDQDRGTRGTLFKELASLLQVDRFGNARHHRNSQFFSQRPSLGLVPEQFQRGGCRADEGDSRFSARACKVRVLAQESVARMDRVAPRLSRRSDDGFNVQIGTDAATIQGHSIVRSPYVQRTGIVPGIQGNGTDAKIRRRSRDADRDLAAVSDEEIHSLAAPLSRGL